MTTPPSYPTLWPTGFDPDADRAPVSAIVVDETDRQSMHTSLHTHKRGQVTLSVEGVVGMDFNFGTWWVPSGCAVWVPPGQEHCGLLSPGSVSIYLMLDHTFSLMLGYTPLRFMINRMTFEIIRSLATRKLPENEVNSLANVLREEFMRALILPEYIAPMPSDERLKRLGQAFLDHPHATNKDFAKLLNMTEKTLARLVKNQLGMTILTWRQHVIMSQALAQLIQDEPVESVALSIGYETPSGFIAAFKRLFGQTPGQFKAQNLL